MAGDSRRPTSKRQRFTAAAAIAGLAFLLPASGWAEGLRPDKAPAATSAPPGQAVLSPAPSGPPPNPADPAASRQVRVGIYQNRPKVFQDADGRPAGIFVDLLNEIAAGENWRLEYVPCAWSECLEELAAGRLDLMPDVAYSRERGRRYDFHETPVVESWSQAYTNKSRPLTTLADLNGRRIALLRDSIQQGVIEQMLSGFGYKATIVPCDTFEEAFRLTGKGATDAVIANHHFGDYFFQDYGLQKTPIIFNPVSLYFAAGQGRNPELLAVIDRRLNSWRNQPDSSYYQTLGRWMAKPPARVVPRYLVWGLVITGSVLTLAVGIILLLRRQVRERTRHLRQSDRSLRRSEEKFRNLFETMEQGVIYQDAKGAVLTANPAAERFLGLSLDRMQHHTFATLPWQLVHEDNSPFRAEEQPAVIALQTGRSVSGVVMGVRDPVGGSTRWILVNAIPSFLPGESAPHEVYTTFSDITERKRAEEALANQYRELEQVFTAMPEAMIYADTQRRIIKVNPAFGKIFGYAAAEVVGLSTSLLYAQPEDFEEQGRLRYGPPAATSYEPYEISYRRKDGGLFTGETVGSNIRDHAGLVVGMLALVRDVTEHRKLEESLQQAQKMESVGRMAGGIAHDYNNTISVVLGYAELAREVAGSSEPMQGYIKEIIEAAQRSAEITRQLLAFARKQPIAPRVLDLNETIGGVLKMLQRLIGENIKLEWEQTPGLWPVKMDPVQIDQILTNLCVNARDAISGGGKVTIHTENAIFDEGRCEADPGFASGSYVRLSVSDNGCGMDQATRELIFEPFFTTKEVGKGTGLGLATVYGIVKQNNGFIDVSSEPGQGTTFSLCLPALTGITARALPGKTAGIPKSLGETILVVEDEPAILKLAETMLGKMGYQVLSASTPNEARQHAENHPGPIHLLMTDVVLPEVNGRELAEQIKAIRPATICLFMSGYPADAIGNRDILAEGVHFIQKPFTMQGLAAGIRAALDHAP